MASESTPEISVRSIELPAHVATSVWASRFRQAKSDGIIIFAVFTFCGLGVARIARLLFFSDISSVHSFAFGLTCGILAGTGILFLNFVDWPLIRKDLKAGICVDASVVCNRATRIRLQGSSLEGVALDCGNDVLVLIGDWWVDKTRLDIWDNPTCRKRFPAKRFRIQFLPRSGQVLFVQVIEGPLPINEPEPVEPMVALDFTKYSEVVHVKQTFRSVVCG